MIHLSPQIESEKHLNSLNYASNLKNFRNSEYVLIHLFSQSVAKPCSSSSCDETIVTKFKIKRLVKTNFTQGTKQSSVIFQITLQKM